MTIKAPDLGVDVAEVSEILVKVGDVIEKDQSLLVLESAKASVEVPSPVSGTIKTIVIKTGQSVKQGDVLFELEDADNASTSDDQPDTAQSSNKNELEPKQADDTESDQTKSQSAQSKHAQNATEAETAESVLKEVTVPDLGVDEAEVSEILVSVDDVVEKNQSLLILVSAKASVEVPSPF
ncbi:MAG: biotin/lipoyl-binding protein, partial [Moraxellaceae bacterium]